MTRDPAGFAVGVAIGSLLGAGAVVAWRNHQANGATQHTVFVRDDEIVDISPPLPDTVA